MEGAVEEKGLRRLRRMVKTTRQYDGLHGAIYSASAAAASAAISTRARIIPAP